MSLRREPLSSQSDAREIQRRSRRQAPFSPARTADSSPAKRSTSTAAAAWADDPFAPQFEGPNLLTLTIGLRAAADRLIATAAGEDDDLVTKQVPAVDRFVWHVSRPRPVSRGRSSSSPGRRRAAR